MEGRKRNIFPGGNTPMGFYSYYRYILSQEKAEHIYCLKGGPGVGKSTLMKGIADYFITKGESVDTFWCSADPDSLDGILIRDRNISIVDGTAPHVMDPLNPGAVDEIIDLAQYLDNNKLSKQKKEIVECSKNVSNCFKEAYRHLNKAGIKYELLSITGEEAVINSGNILKDFLNEKCNRIRLAGEEKRFFSRAITYKGIVDFTETLFKGINNIFTIDGKPGMKTEEALKPVANRLLDSGFDVELYYSPMCPDMRIEHIVSTEADLAIVTLYNEQKEQIEQDFTKVFDSLKKAKLLHDELESFYVPAMNFIKTEEMTCRLIKEIEEKY